MIEDVLLYLSVRIEEDVGEEKNEILGCSKFFSPLSCGLFVVKLIRGEEGIERGVKDSKTVDSSLFILLFRI